MEGVSEQYSFGVICRYKDKYLSFKSKTLYVFHKGHYQDQDSQIVTPYDDIQMLPVNKLYQYPQFITKKSGAAIIAGVRELMQQSGFILPSQSLKLKLKDKYKQQGKLLFINNNKIECVQQQPYNFHKGNTQIRKYVTYFFAQLFEDKPIAKRPKNLCWFTKQQYQKSIETSNFRETSMQLLKAFFSLEHKYQ